MSDILSYLKGVVCLIDDVLIHGKTQEEHDCRLRNVLERIKLVGLTLNAEKCEFSKSSIKFLSLMINEKGVSPDPDKTQAIIDLKQSKQYSNVIYRGETLSWNAKSVL